MIIVTPKESYRGEGDNGTGRGSQNSRQKLKDTISGKVGLGTLNESDSYEDPEIRHAQENKRTIKMNTNRNPDLVESTPPTSNPIEETSSAVIEDTKPLSPQFIALSKQRRALQLERKALDEAKAQMSTSGSGSDIVAQLQQGNLDVLMKQGVTWDQLSRAVTNYQQSSPTRDLEAKFDSWKQEFETKQTEREVQQEEQVISEMMRNAQALVNESGEKYELVRVTNSMPKVKELIRRTWKEEGIALTEEQALDDIEEALEEEALKYADTQKVKSKLIPQSSQSRGMRTLANRDGASPQISRRARAIAVFQGK